MIREIYTSEATGAEMASHTKIEVIAEGLKGDRYATGKGHYTGVEEWDAHVTLIEIEPFDKLASEEGVELDPAILRRNLVVESVSLDSLLEKRFRIGDEVILETRKLWPPCNFIVKSTGREEIVKYLAKSSGIGASVIQGGTVRLGDSIVAIEE